jgi:hypothetical protein
MEKGILGIVVSIIRNYGYIFSPDFQLIPGGGPLVLGK